MIDSRFKSSIICIYAAVALLFNYTTKAQLDCGAYSSDCTSPWIRQSPFVTDVIIAQTCTTPPCPACTVSVEVSYQTRCDEIWVDDYFISWSPDCDPTSRANLDFAHAIAKEQCVSNFYKSVWGGSAIPCSSGVHTVISVSETQCRLLYWGYSKPSGIGPGTVKVRLPFCFDVSYLDMYNACIADGADPATIVCEISGNCGQACCRTTYNACINGDGSVNLSGYHQETDPPNSTCNSNACNCRNFCQPSY